MSDSCVDSENERSTSKSSVKKIPISNDIRDEFSLFFNSSNTSEDYKFIFDLDQYNSVSIWKNSSCGMDKTDQRIPFETPVGMKTIDHYFSKRSSLNKSFDSNTTENEKSIKQSKTVSKSPIKSSNDKDESKLIMSSPPKKHQNDTDNILSQDIFDRNDSVSSNEYSKQNEEILGDCDVVPCTQFDESIVSKFNTSNLINSGSVADRSSNSDSEYEYSNVSALRKSSLTSKDSCNEGSVKRCKVSSDRSSVVSKGEDRMIRSNKIKNHKRNSYENTTSLSKVNIPVIMKKPECSKRSRNSSSSDEETKSVPKANTSVNLNKSKERKSRRSSSSSDEDSNSPLRVNTSVTLNKPKDRKNNVSSSSSDEEPKSASKADTSVNLNKSKDKKGSTSLSSSYEDTKSISKANTSVNLNKSKDRKGSTSLSSSDEETKSVSKANTSVNLNKSKDRKGSTSPSSSDEETKSASKANTSVNLNKSKDRKGSTSLSSSYEDTKSISKANTSVNLNKSKDRKGSMSPSSSDEETKPVSKANTSVNLNKSKDRKGSTSPSSSDEETKSVSKDNTSVNLNKSKERKSNRSSSSSDEDSNSALRVNSSVTLNKPKDRKSSVSPSSSDEEIKLPSKANTLVNMNKSRVKKRSGSSSSSDEESKSTSKALLQTSLNLNKSRDKKRSGSSSSSDEETGFTSKANSSVNLNKSSDEKRNPKSTALGNLNSSRGKNISNSSTDDEETGCVQKRSLKVSQNEKKSGVKNKIQLLNKENSSSPSSDSEVDKRNTVVDKRKFESISNSEDEKKHLKSIKLREKVKNDSSESSEDESNTNKSAYIDNKLKGKLIGVTLKKAHQSSSEESDNNSRSSNSNFKKSENKQRVKENNACDNPSRKSKEKNEQLKKEVSIQKGHRNDDSDDSTFNSVNSKKNVYKSSDLKSVKERSRSESLSDDNEFSFKNKEIGKMLGLNAIGSTRNMSLSGHKAVKTLDKPEKNDPGTKLLPKKNDQSFTEDSESDSSSSEDEKEKKEVNIKKLDVLKEQSMLFAPSASSSFMVNNTPDALTRKHSMKMTNVETVQRDHKIKDNDSSSEGSKNHEQTVIRNDKRSLKRKHSSDSDQESDKSNSVKTKFEENKNFKRKRSESISEHTSSKKSKIKHQVASDLKMEVDQQDSSDDEDNLKTKRPDWLDEIVKNKRQITAGDKLKVENSICFEDISSEDEIYTLQCPKELNVDSLMGKKISLTGDSLFEGLTKDNQSLAFETFAVSLPSKINLLLPSKIESTLKLGGFEVKGSIIVSERCFIPEVDMSTFSSTGKESSSEDELNISTPLPSGLKLRHPLHGLNYKKTALPNFDAVISREKKRNKKKNKKHDQEETVEEMIDSLVAKKKLSLKGHSDEFKKPLAPKPSGRGSGSSTMGSDKESERGVVIGRNMISLVSDDESRASSKEEQRKKKKKHIPDIAESVVQEIDNIKEDSNQSKKKKKKDKLMDQIIKDVKSSIGVTSTLDPFDSEGSVTKTKKKKKRNKAEQEEPEENSVPVEESQPEIKKKKKKKKEKDID